MKKCKKCNIEKPLEEFYSHKKTRDGRLSKCKVCILEERKTPEALERAKINDKKRNQTERRKNWVKKQTKKFREENPEKWNAHKLVNNFFRSFPEYKTNICVVCWKESLIHYHHFDYTKPNEVIPCCAYDHRKFHNWEEVREEYILKLPFEKKKSWDYKKFNK